MTLIRVSVTRGVTAILRPNIFIGDPAPTNIAPYIPQCHITDKYILNLSVPTNKLNYVCRRYIHRRIHWLTDEFMLYSSV
jgi:hypothetical protein